MGREQRRQSASLLRLGGWFLSFLCGSRKSGVLPLGWGGECSHLGGDLTEHFSVTQETPFYLSPPVYLAESHRAPDTLASR